MFNFSSKRLIGGVIGLACGLLFLLIGFWKTVLLVSLALVGCWIASDFKGFDGVISYFIKLFKR